MRLKGDVDTVGLGELFQTLASQRATGVLTVVGPREEKVIAISAGEIAVVTEKTAERSRLGDLLVARGRLTEEQLATALKTQRESDQRTKLGELLVKTGLIRPEDIVSSLRFQLEEEICDLFTWRGATFDFDSQRSIEEVCADDLGDLHLQRMSIEPQAVIAEASRRMNDWKTIEARLPTPYLCFKVTPKGEELAARAATGTQLIFKLLKEGRTIETTVKRSCAGRFNVCRTIVKLLDEGWMFPYPAGDLPTLAAEHRAHHRFSDALYIYRRLLDATQGEVERKELQSLIDDTLLAIRRAQEAGESVEGAETVSYKEAAARYRRRRFYRRAAALTFCGGALIAATFVLSQTYRPPPRLSEDYQEAMHAAAEAVHQHKYEEAGRIWEAFYAKIPNKEGATAQLVLEHLSNLPLQSIAYIERLIAPVEAKEKAGRLDEAEAGYNKLLELFGHTRFAERIRAGLERIEAKRAAAEQARTLAELRVRVAAAQKLWEQKRYTAARAAFTKLVESTEPGTPERRDAETGLQRTKDLESKAQAAVQDAESELRDQKGEKAIESFEAAAGIWADLPAAESARRESQRLKAKLEQGGQELAAAERVAARGGTLEALESLRRIQREYAEFDLRRKAAERITKLKADIDAIVAEITAAQATFERDKALGRRQFAALIREHAEFLASRNIEVPFHVTSQPSAATVKVDGAAAGVTPLDIKVPAAKAFVLRVETPGYEADEQKIVRLAPEDLLETHIILNREALCVQEFGGAIMAPPRVLDQCLYVLHGTGLSALDSRAKETLWSLPGLFDDTKQTRPASDGSGVPQFVNDRTWWYPRWPPEQFGAGKLILALRTREIIEIDTAKHSFERLLSVPIEPVGQPYVERVSLLVGKALIAVGCADGNVRTYELGKVSMPIWEKPADPAHPAPVGTLATGLVSRAAGSIMALSRSGRLTSFSMTNGQENWSMVLGGTVTPSSTLPVTPGENLAALVLADGRVTVVDVSQHEKVWELPVARALDEAAHATVASDAIYVITREGSLRKYPRGKQAGRPAPLWTKALDGGTEVPLCAGKNVYAVSSFGTLYALSADDGHELWKYKVKGAVTHLVEYGRVLYVATKGGRLVVLNTE
ncbi:MAG: PQQ-binding-like beta-propeller repeat protein [Planctomycetota bacterium]|nr:PQQ-binding-like beta-propeller repeat protein [Planctomycetota bacterium]